MKYLQMYLKHSKCLIKLSIIITPSLSSVTHLGLGYSETDNTGKCNFMNWVVIGLWERIAFIFARTLKKQMTLQISERCLLSLSFIHTRG